jgi:hypothetical protein
MSFEIFGFDFMVSEDAEVYLIECNTNPAIETKPGDHIMAWLVPHMIESALRIAVDPILTPHFSIVNQR